MNRDITDKLAALFWVEQAHRLGLDADDTPPPWRWTPGCI